MVQSNIAALEGHGEDGVESHLDVEGAAPAAAGLPRKAWIQLREAAANNRIDVDERVSSVMGSDSASLEFDGIALEEALLDALHPPSQDDDAEGNDGDANPMSAPLAAWENAWKEAQRVWAWRARSSHLPVGGRFGHNMSLVAYIPVHGASPTVKLVHWSNPNTWRGQIVRTDRNNCLVTITPMMDPIVNLSQHGEPLVVCPDAGERGDRRRPKDIRIPIPPEVGRLGRMWLAGLQPKQTPVPCTVCGLAEKEDGFFMCCNCLLSFHQACEDQLHDRLQSMRVPVTPQRPPAGFPNEFYTVLCKACASIWVPPAAAEQARLLCVSVSKIVLIACLLRVALLLAYCSRSVQRKHSHATFAQTFAQHLEGPIGLKSM